MQRLQKRLRALPPEVLKGLLRGVEKESLRVRPDGKLADTRHPRGLGSPLTHARITTDFSESQLELITGVHSSPAACANELQQIHQIVYRHIGDEMLWCASMPCGLPAEDDIPLGQYGSSNIGKAKTVYRQGLSHRYGRRMQTISGVHYNFSLPPAAWPLLQQADEGSGPVQTYQNDAYFALLRNCRRHAWLLLYLFGASPAVCASFVAGHSHSLQQLGRGTLYLPYSTSLRMGPLGYQSEAQTSLAVSYNDLESYARSLYRAMTEPYPPYAAIGIHDGKDYRQLATTLLQIENEFYTTARPKRIIRRGERPLHALSERGVEYVEVRCLDLDPYCGVGIAVETMRFLDIFLLHCLLAESPPDTHNDLVALSRNRYDVAQRGRDPDLRLLREGETIPVREWAGELLRECEPIADALDKAHGTRAYGEALLSAAQAFVEASNTPSARVLQDMERNYGNSYVRFVLDRSARHRAEVLALPLPGEVAARYARLAEESLAAQQEIEMRDNVPFEVYRQQYLTQDLLSGDGY